MKSTIFLFLFALLATAGTAQEASAKKQQPASTPVQTPVVEKKENTQGSLSNKKMPDTGIPNAMPVKEETPATATTPAVSNKRKPD